ncbi:MAG TPA: hypothetical protein VGE29_11145 [Prosthecobacter sp.]
MSDRLYPQECLTIIAELARILPDILKKGMAYAAFSNPFADDDLDKDERHPWEPVFIGGGIVALLISDPAAPSPSSTKDLDLILEHRNDDRRMRMDIALREAGFTQDLFNEDPLFTWYHDETRIDFLPDQDSEMFGRTNRWFQYVMREAQRVVLHGSPVWIASAPCFLATKFEAFRSRGRGDYLGSKDMEDIIAVVDGRMELFEDVGNASLDVRRFLAQCCQELCQDERFLDQIGNLVPESGREAEVLSRLQKLANV